MSPIPKKFSTLLLTVLSISGVFLLTGPSPVAAPWRGMTDQTTRTSSPPPATGLLARWTFDETSDGAVIDSVTGGRDKLTGNYRVTAGVSGKAIKLDGYTTVVTRKASQSPVPAGAFRVSAWIALAAYPWNWCPILCHQDENAGYSLEIGPDGELAMKTFTGTVWRSCISEVALPLRTWVHVAGVFDPDSGLSVWMDGQEKARLPFRGRMTVARRADLLIGSTPTPLKPAWIHRESGTLPDYFSLDAIMDEVEIRAVAGPDRGSPAPSARPAAAPEIAARVLPSGPPGPGRFGAYSTELEFYWEWDDLWRTAEHPDIVVQFDGSPVRLVFWRGTRYSPAWVSENNLWMADQSVEAWNDEEGCFEHMQDRHCVYSHVRIIENTPARVVVHWRYAPVSAYDNLWRVDPRTGWGCWVDEYYTVYPDQTAVRTYTWEKGTLGQPRQFQESIPLTSPGQRQGDVIDADYVTVANLAGDRQVYSYVEAPGPEGSKKAPPDPSIQRHNLKARNKPFIVFEPGGQMQYLRDMNIAALARPGACSHWPVGQMRCDGRTQRTFDRATSFLGFPITDPVVHEGETREWANSLYGMNDRSFESLISLARSWARPPQLRVEGGPGAGLTSRGYDMKQRAYVLERPAGIAGKGSPAVLVFDASADSPLVNACLVVKNWGDGVPGLILDGVPAVEGRDVRFGPVPTLDGKDLVVWIAKESTAPVRIEWRAR